MEKDIAFMLVKIGAKIVFEEALAGVDFKKIKEDDLTELLKPTIDRAWPSIMAMADKIVIKHTYHSWYAQNFTAQDAYKFGLEDGFQLGINGSELTPEMSDLLTKKTFSQTKMLDQLVEQ